MTIAVIEGCAGFYAHGAIVVEFVAKLGKETGISLGAVIEATGAKRRRSCGHGVAFAQTCRIDLVRHHACAVAERELAGLRI